MRFLSKAGNEPKALSTPSTPRLQFPCLENEGGGFNYLGRALLNLNSLSLNFPLQGFLKFHLENVQGLGQTELGIFYYHLEYPPRSVHREQEDIWANI